MALRTYRAMDCRQLSRIDFMLNSKGEPFVLETNTIPGMTETSLFPDAAKAAGISLLNSFLCWLMKHLDWLQKRKLDA